MDGKYARSADEAAERGKAKAVQKTKKTLDTFKARETSIIQNLNDLLCREDGLEDGDADKQKHTVRLTRNDLEAGKRVLSITDVTGISMERSTLVLTSDLSLLESKMPVNSNVPVKSFVDDAENDVDETKSESSSTPPQLRSIFGVIKVFLANVRNCTIIVKCKIITGTIELHNCHNVCIRVEKEATAATIQLDGSDAVTIEFHDAFSGKHVPGQKPPLFWGDDKDDRIFHAGVSNMLVRIYRDGYLESERTADYLTDGAQTIGNATALEYQFVTSVFENTLITEAVVRAGNSTGKNVRAMTDREMAVEQDRRDRAAKCAVKMAEDMIQVRDKDGNILVRKSDGNDDNNIINDDAVVEEEIYTSMSNADIKLIVDECDHLKARGNEAFAAGEYGQSILHYSLCLDKAQELPDADTNSASLTYGSVTMLFPRDVIYSNRAAAFLKMGQHEKAVEDAVRALQINPDNLKAKFRQGLALHAMGNYSDALPILAAAHKREPQNRQIKQALQFCEVRREQEHRQRMAGGGAV